MIPAHCADLAEWRFDGMDAHELAIYHLGFQDGQHSARNEAQPRLSDLEIRIDMATKEELDLDEIHETDINRGLEALIEIKAYHGE